MRLANRLLMVHNIQPRLEWEESLLETLTSEYKSTSKKVMFLSGQVLFYMNLYEGTAENIWFYNPWIGCSFKAAFDSLPLSCFRRQEVISYSKRKMYIMSTCPYRIHTTLFFRIFLRKRGCCPTQYISQGIVQMAHRCKSLHSSTELSQARQNVV